MLAQSFRIVLMLFSAVWIIKCASVCCLELNGVKCRRRSISVIRRIRFYLWGSLVEMIVGRYVVDLWLCGFQFRSIHKRASLNASSDLVVFVVGFFSCAVELCLPVLKRGGKLS